jgi:putative endonuclease
VTGAPEPKKPQTDADRDRQEAYRLGVDAELVSEAFLKERGYRLLARRFKVGEGEIDIIARTADTLVFVEVKARRSRDLGLDAVTPRGWKRIARAADEFMARHPEYRDFGWRYDLIVIVPGEAPHHEIDAWRPDW